MDVLGIDGLGCTAIEIDVQGIPATQGVAGMNQGSLGWWISASWWTHSERSRV